jgi:hypothetical protein
VAGLLAQARRVALRTSAHQRRLRQPNLLARLASAAARRQRGGGDRQQRRRLRRSGKQRSEQRSRKLPVFLNPVLALQKGRRRCHVSGRLAPASDARSTHQHARQHGRSGNGCGLGKRQRKELQGLGLNKENAALLRLREGRACNGSPCGGPDPPGSPRSRLRSARASAPAPRHEQPPQRDGLLCAPCRKRVQAAPPQRSVGIQQPVQLSRQRRGRGLNGWRRSKGRHRSFALRAPRTPHAARRGGRRCAAPQGTRIEEDGAAVWRRGRGSPSGHLSTLRTHAKWLR